MAAFGPNRRAITLIELLVVIAVIGILMALMLPVVEGVRETARRTDCANRLRQVTLALQAYTQSAEIFPSGAVLEPNYPEYDKWYDPWTEAGSQSPGKQGTSWLLEILPWIEQDAIHAQWDRTRSVSGNKHLAAHDIPLLYCPSRRGRVRPADQAIMFRGWSEGGTDYGACLGRCNGWRNDHGGCLSVSHKFLVSNTLFDPKKRGVFGPNTSVPLARIVDGVSNTILVGEMQRLRPNPALTGVEKSSRTSNDGWALGGVATLFTTAVHHEDGDLGQTGGMNNWFFESAGSEHLGGAHFGFGDGAVRFLSEHIDSQIYARMGSIADGGTVVLP